jgi:hypothetical protein
VVCPEWRELESYDNIRSAKNKLLTKKETKVNTVKDWGKVTIKLCLTRGTLFGKNRPPGPPAKTFYSPSDGNMHNVRRTNRSFVGSRGGFSKESLAAGGKK